MAANLIVSAGTVADSPGLGQNSHIFYAANTALWWCFQFRSASATTLYARYSSDLATWNDPTNNTFTLLHSNGGSGITLGVAYRNIASTDVVHCTIPYKLAADRQTHLRATLSGTTVTWGTEIEDQTTQLGSNAVFYGGAVAIASDGAVFESGNVDSQAGANSGDFGVRKSTNTDAGSSWSTGFPTALTLLFSSVATARSSGYRALSSGGKVIGLGDNGAVTNTPTQILYSLWGGASWSPATATAVFATTVSIDINDWGMCLLSDSDVHAVRRNDSTSTFTHRRWNGTSWGAGQSIPNNTCKAGAGLAMASDGTSVWLCIIDSDGANTVRYIQWTAGAWGSWTALESTTQVRKFVTAVYGNSTLAVGWAQTNGSNFDYMVAGLSLAAGFTWQSLTENQYPAELLYKPEVIGY